MLCRWYLGVSTKNVRHMKSVSEDVEGNRITVWEERASVRCVARFRVDLTSVMEVYWI